MSLYWFESLNRVSNCGLFDWKKCFVWSKKNKIMMTNLRARFILIFCRSSLRAVNLKENKKYSWIWREYFDDMWKERLKGTCEFKIGHVLQDTHLINDIMPVTPLLFFSSSVTWSSFVPLIEGDFFMNLFFFFFSRTFLFSLFKISYLI